MVSIDTWRWDHIGVSGSGKVRTPHLDELAREGVYGREVITPYPLTTPAHASLFTGLLPTRHGVLDCTHYRMEGRVRTLAGQFREAGFATAAFISGETLRKRYGLDRGFDLYDDSGLARRGEGDSMPASKDGVLVVEAVEGYIRGLEAGRPAFVFAHFFDLHGPHRPHPEFDAQYPGNPYASEAAYVDSLVGRMVETLRGDRSRNWRILVVGDHGEGLGDHHENGHGIGLYRSTLHVPLILYPKPARWSDPRGPWGLVDLAPTICTWMGLKALPGTDGLDLLKSSDSTEGRALLCLTVLPSVMFSVNPCFGARQGPMMYIRHGVEELYDAERDAGQTRNLAADPIPPDHLEALRTLVLKSFSISSLQELLIPTLASTAQDLDNLRGLGYVEGPVPRLEALQKADIREVLEEYNLVEAARETAYQTGDLKVLRQVYERFIGKYPRAATVWKNLAKTQLRMGDEKEAEVALERAIRLDARDGDSMVNLGVLRLKQGKPRDAEALLLTALGLDPEDVVAHKNLGILYGQFLKDPAKSRKHFQRFIELSPDSPEAAQIQKLLQGVPGTSGESPKNGAR